MSPEISIVVPLYNEAPNVAPLVRQVFAALPEPARVELLLVDDGSSDETWARMREAAQADARVRALRHTLNCGQSAALWTGLDASRGPIIATLDGDLQNDPVDLPRMVARLNACDLVCGVRAHRQDSWVRRVSSRIARLARKWVLGVDFRDTGCALRAFKRSILPVVPRFNGVHRFFPVLAHAGGARVEEMAVAHHPRTAGVSKYGIGNRLGRGIYDLLMLRWFLQRQFKRVQVVEFDPKSISQAGIESRPR